MGRARRYTRTMALKDMRERHSRCKLLRATFKGLAMGLAYRLHSWSIDYAGFSRRLALKITTGKHLLEVARHHRGRITVEHRRGLLRVWWCSMLDKKLAPTLDIPRVTSRAQSPLESPNALNTVTNPELPSLEVTDTDTLVQEAKQAAELMTLELMNTELSNRIKVLEQEKAALQSDTLRREEVLNQNVHDLNVALAGHQTGPGARGGAGPAPVPAGQQPSRTRRFYKP